MNSNTVNDSTIVELLFKRSETALTHISEKYGRLYVSIIRGAVERESDVEECANDLLLAVWNSIPPNQPTHLPSYICTIARRIGVSRHRENMRDKRILGYGVILEELTDSVPDRGALRDESGHLQDVIASFLDGLDTKSRVLFVRRYMMLESVKSLAERYGTTENYVSVSLHRTRKKLRKFLSKEGIVK